MLERRIEHNSCKNADNMNLDFANISKYSRTINPGRNIRDLGLRYLTFVILGDGWIAAFWSHQLLLDGM
jgi:hypothetical protein